MLALALLAGCERDPAREPVPTYPDSKLDVMRSVTGETLPDPHRTREAASAPASTPAPSR